jgi:hypothetical protein
VTAFQIEWWTPLWKRLLLMSFWVGMTIWSMLDVSVGMLAFAAVMLGYTWHEMFIGFGHVRLPD